MLGTSSCHPYTLLCPSLSRGRTIQSETTQFGKPSRRASFRDWVQLDQTRFYRRGLLQTLGAKFRFKHVRLKQRIFFRTSLIALWKFRRITAAFLRLEICTGDRAPTPPKPQALNKPKTLNLAPQPKPNKPETLVCPRPRP